MREKEKTIPNFKIKYKNGEYADITNFGIDGWDNRITVHFTNRDSQQRYTNVNCGMEDIEIIRE